MLKHSGQNPDKGMLYLLQKFKNDYFEQAIDKINQEELQSNKTNTSDIEALFLDLKSFISNKRISTKIYVNGAILILLL